MDSWRTTHEALNITLKTMGYPTLSEEGFLKRPHTSLRESFPVVFKEQWKKAEEVYYDAYQNIHLSRLSVFPGAEELLNFLHKKGVFLAIISNKNGKFLRREVEHLQWIRYFKMVLGSYDLKYDKPASQVVDYALKESSILPGEEVWFVGDSDVDVECARNSRCFPVLIDKTVENQRVEDGMMRVQDCLSLWKILGSQTGIDKN